ncbi:unnamed protein product (macronuclear) [Paramecium tetraurelia]|uniref:Uncharacterized protein n=1 Tax=Paramecium tetraurelia TaxID=5888 RepID=A0EEP0_PARTE|nr:uncharacterized protein GSPATT00026103001 [Paramecium tetraurelia]CAK93781.1 unnamed protein product [Paramecium tetraurelia]|eukprot:XP_001461154.1 hypothetical protein (macronuclear) [Paramecium tetraurelia strain d4-2]
MIKNNTNLDALNGLKYELQIIEDQKTQELKDLKLFFKTLQQKVWDLKRKNYNQKICFIDPLLRDSLLSMQHLIGLKAEAIRQLEDEKYNQQVDREKLVVLHKYQESGVEVHHAYTKYIQSENLKGLRDLPHSYKLLELDLEIEVERKRQLKQQLESQKKQTEELQLETRKKLEEATSFHHLLQQKIDQEKN